MASLSNMKLPLSIIPLDFSVVLSWRTHCPFPLQFLHLLQQSVASVSRFIIFIITAYLTSACLSVWFSSSLPRLVYFFLSFKNNHLSSFYFFASVYQIWNSFCIWFTLDISVVLSMCVPVVPFHVSLSMHLFRHSVTSVGLCIIQADRCCISLLACLICNIQLVYSCNFVFLSFWFI